MAKDKLGSDDLKIVPDAGSVKRNVKWTGSPSVNPTITTPGGRG